MKKCCFYGNIDFEDIDYVLLAKLYKFFDYLISKRNVGIFYSAAKNDFDRLCEGVVNSLKSKYSFIKLIRVVPPSYKHFITDDDLTDTPFDEIIFAQLDEDYEPALIRQRYKWIIDNSDYMAACVTRDDRISRELLEYTFTDRVTSGKISIKNLAQ